MQIEIWHVTGDSFHFGRHGLQQEESGAHMPSDSLFAALVARLAEIQGDDAVRAFGAPFLAGKPPFILSSAFPRAGTVLFFPPPLKHTPPDRSLADGPRPKDLKRVQFVSEGVFRRLLAGEQLAGMWAAVGKLHKSKVIYLPEEAAKLPAQVREGENIWKIERRSQVAIGRAVQNSQLYHTGRTVFHEDCGLWFGIRWLHPSADLRALIQMTFQELGDAGLGGERSRGYGTCQIEAKGSLELPEATSETLWITLSRYLPQDQAEAHALLHEHAAFALETVRGWVTSPDNAAQRRRAVNMLVEGSVLGPLPTQHPGQMVDVQPDYNGTRPLTHPVWRNGLALSVGLQAKVSITST